MSPATYSGHEDAHPNSEADKSLRRSDDFSVQLGAN